MKNCKRLMAWVISIAMLGCIPAGCGKGDQTSNSGGQGTGGTKYKINVATLGQYPVKNDARYIQLLNEKYNIELNIWPCFGEEYSNQVNMKIAGGEIPDLIKVAGGLDPVQLVDQDVIMDISEEFIKENMPKYYEDLCKQSDAPFKYSKIDGKIYGLPGTSADGGYHFSVIWRSDWLRDLGITKVPETLDEFESAFYKFTNDDPNHNNKKDTYGLSNLGMLPIFGAFGYLPYNNSSETELYSLRDDKIVHSATQPEMKEALKLLNKWYNEGVVDPEFITGERTTGHWSSSQAFASGRIGYSSPGMYYNTGRMSEIGIDGKFYKLFTETQKGLGITNSDYVHGRPPIGRDGKTSGTLKWGVEQGINYAFGTSLEKDSGKLKRIASMLDDIWMDFDNYMSCIYGVKNEDWTYNAETGELKIGLGELTKVASEKEDWASIGLGYLFIADLATMMKVQTPMYYTFADKVVNYTEGYTDPIINTPLQTRTKYGADLLKMTLMAYSDMISGKKPIDTYFDEYVKEWEAAGGKEILKEANEWYKENVKK